MQWDARIKNDKVVNYKVVMFTEFKLESRFSYTQMGKHEDEDSSIILFKTQMHGYIPTTKSISVVGRLCKW